METPNATQQQSPKPAVFIVNNSGHDFSDAQRFGELVSMTRDTVNRFDITEMKRRFEQFISLSTPNDFILHTGPGVMSAIACAMFAAKHRCLNLLLWQPDEDGVDRYVCKRMIL